MGFIEEQLVDFDEAAEIYKKRSNEFLEIKVSLNEKESKLANGYEEYKRPTKNFCFLKKRKEHDEIFEDKVWCLFYKMGFKKMSKDRNFLLKHGESNGCTQQVDVFCVDDECVLIVECKSKEKVGPATYKNNIDAYKGNMDGFKQYIQEEFGREKKIVFIYATNNVIWSDADAGRLNEIRYVKKEHMDEENIQYYYDLSNNLGPAAKYQLLGNLFRGDEIKAINAEVPAIKGKMGDTIYYSFLIEPEKLLKFCYVLHRNSTHSTKDLSPSYQRVIKKDRLEKIRKYVNEGGFFPNSIIISIDTKDPSKKELQFDSVGKIVEGTKSRVGILHLPKTYQSAFIIDGQHRVYGYSESAFAKTDTVPVIAFVNMDKNEQVQMFMDINQNQKPVAKNLRNTLEEFLLWDSQKGDEVRKAIMLRVSMHLGTDNKSALYKRIITGEDAKTQTMCITLETMRLALDKTHFFNKYKGGVIKETGIFDFGDSNESKDKTLDCLISILENYFKKISINLPDEWEKGDDGYLCINNTIYGLIILLDEFVTYLKNKDGFDTKVKPINEINELINDELVDVVSVVLSDITREEIDTHLLKRGAGGTAEAGRYLCYKVHQQINSFSPVWLPSYMDDNFQDNNEEANNILRDILVKTRKIFYESLFSKYGDDWELMAMNSKINSSLNTKKNEINRSLLENGGKKSDKNIIEFADFGDLDIISREKDNWSTCFSKYFKNKDKLFDNEKNLLLKFKSLYNDVSKKHNIRKKDFDDLSQFYERFNGSLDE